MPKITIKNYFIYFNIVAWYSKICEIKAENLAITLNAADIFSEHKEDATLLSAAFLERQRKISVNASQEQREYLRNEWIMSLGIVWCIVWSSEVEGSLW